MPWGVALDSNGDVYVSDWRNDRVQKFDPSGRYLAQWGSSGDGEGQFKRPSGLAVDPDGNIYVCDWGNERVQVLSPSGQVLACFRGDSVTSTWASSYFEANPDEGAARLAADLEPQINPRSDHHRETSANVEKLLWGPTSVKLDGQGRIYIVDSLRHRLQIYRLGS
jgi:DNA-binding beta-propeller fold protein YncE